jgi:hypothetical protein
MKKTAVEWLEKIHQGQKVQPFDDYEWEIAFNHAKEMERDQIVEAFDDGAMDTLKLGKEYYNYLYTEQ